MTKILVISSDFGIGGYGQLCEEVCGYLAEMGHSIHVLTCPGEKTNVDSAINISESLARDPDWNSKIPGLIQFFLYRRRRERHNLHTIEKKLNQFSPDIVFVWQGTGLHRSLYLMAERMGYPVVYRLCDYWPSISNEYLVYWHKPAVQGRFRFLKQYLSSLALAQLRNEGEPLSVSFDYSICVSDAVCNHLQKMGVPLRKAVTIFNGINLQDFIVDLEKLPYPRRKDGKLTLLYGGALVEHKGVHVALEAIHILQTESPNLDVHLTILGEGPKSYVTRLQRLVKEWQLEKRIQFVSPVPRSQMPAVLRKHDVLLFPSLYEEPLARMMQEAMASGVVVVGTATGGSIEILHDGINALVCEAGDAEGMAKQIRSLSDANLACHLAYSAQKTMIEKCDIQRTTRDIEAYLNYTIAESKKNE